MKEIKVTYDRRGVYLPNEPIAFDGETALEFVVEEHRFELKLSGEVLRKAICPGYRFVVGADGSVRASDAQGTLLAKTDGDGRSFSAVCISGGTGGFVFSFGQTVTVDHYPNCDGESDRYSTTFEGSREVVFSPEGTLSVC
ncbi:MAG: hypothetical protein J6J21_00205 [Clostridia bacterium]|nr:hypothetical protein [Clostridia bacterium]